MLETGYLIRNVSDELLLYHSFFIAVGHDGEKSLRISRISNGRITLGLLNGILYWNTVYDLSVKNARKRKNVRNNLLFASKNVNGVKILKSCLVVWFQNVTLVIGT